ncbi:MAG: POTRA domain-containing protein [Kofleriaceae bacterium]
MAAVAVVMHELPEGRAQAEGHATRPQEIESVALDGRDLPVAELRAVLTTRTGDLLDADKLAADRAGLAAKLASRGYLDARVAPAQVLFDASRAAFVTFAISPGPMFHVRDVRVVGASARDLGIVTLVEGAVASADRVEREREALATRLRARGKPAAVTVTFVPDVETASVDIVLSANEEPTRK